MDFLETDFHQRKSPKCSIRLHNAVSLKVGINITRYQGSIDILWRSIENGFKLDSLFSIKKMQYTMKIPPNYLNLVQRQAEKITAEYTSELLNQIASKVASSVESKHGSLDAAIIAATEDSKELIRSTLANLFIDERLAQSLKGKGCGDDNNLYVLKEEYNGWQNLDKKTVKNRLD